MGTLFNDVSLVYPSFQSRANTFRSQVLHFIISLDESLLG